jgi:N utilization substance protein A
MRGVRIQNIVNELNGEKIDVVAWAPEESQFIAGALSPAKVEHVWLGRESKTATVVVPDNHLSLAIGKEGQNARLAAKLTGWRIDIKSASEASVEAVRRATEEAEARAKEAELAAKREAAAALLAEAEKLLAAEELAASVEAAPTLVAEAAAEPAQTALVAETTPAVIEGAAPVEAAEGPREAAETTAGEAVPELTAQAVEETTVPEVGEIVPTWDGVEV